jgi:hypothetical protein
MGRRGQGKTVGRACGKVRERMDVRIDLMNCRLVMVCVSRDCGERYDLIGRFNGGANAGHTVVVNG